MGHTINFQDNVTGYMADDKERKEAARMERFDGIDG